jgi:hypothetical protein
MITQNISLTNLHKSLKSSYLHGPITRAPKYLSTSLKAKLQTSILGFRCGLSPQQKTHPLLRNGSKHTSNLRKKVMNIITL